VSEGDPLDLDVRRRIYQAVQDQPGLHLRELGRTLDTPLSTLRHHLEVMEEAAILTVERDGDYKRYFPAEALSDEDRRLLSVLRREKPRRILLALLERGGETSYGSLVEALGYAESTLGLYLRELRDRGLVERRPMGRTSVYGLVDDDRVHRLLVTYGESFYDAWVDRVLAIVEELPASKDEQDPDHG